MAFSNLRSQVCDVGNGVTDSGKVKTSRAFHSQQFIRRAQMQFTEYKDKVFVLESKESIKKRLGRLSYSTCIDGLSGYN